jgi:hypothetical protein
MKKIFTITAAALAMVSAASAQGVVKPASSTKPKPVDAPVASGKPSSKPTAKPSTTSAPAGKPSSRPTAQPASGVTTSNQAKPAIVQGPSIRFDKKEHDFGKIVMGPKASVIFAFTNNGTEPIVLTDVKASCGCTTPKWPTEPIAPGATAQIEAVYDTNGRPGYFEKTITVTYAGKTEELKIKGNVDNQGSDKPGTGQF